MYFIGWGGFVVLAFLLSFVGNGVYCDSVQLSFGYLFILFTFV